MYQTFSKIYPAAYRNKLKKLLSYANLHKNSDDFLGFSFVFILLLALALGFLFGAMFSLPFWLSLIGCFFLGNVVFYFWLLLSADSKGKFIELVLPDALQLMASNLRAGFTTDRALLLSARAEFGPLQDEINLVGKEITLGKPITDALKGISERVKSQKLERTMDLIISGIKSGGELASLLDQTSSDLRRQQLIDKKIRSSVNMYVIFIFIAAGFASPVLFGLSSYLVEVLTNSFANTNIPSNVASSVPINFSQVAISVDFIIQYAVISMIVTSIMGSFILGLISKGKEKEGITFMLPLIILSLSLFFLSRYLISSILGGLFGI